MLKQLGNIIEKRPWLVIGIVLMITIGFSTLVPSLEMKTDFSDFMPDNEVVRAGNRISEYFGESQQILFLYAQTENTESVITPKALREQYYIQQELLKNPEIENVYGLPFFVDQVCLVEFGQPFENCTDEQLSTVIKDILEEKGTSRMKIFTYDDPNEEIDYKRYPRLSIGRSIDAIDIKNCYIESNDEEIIVTLEVYDLSFMRSKIRSPIPFNNVMEWYIDFENLITPDQRLDISYRLAAHIEPTYSFWEFGEGALKNIKRLIERIVNREFFSYKDEVYLWIKPFEETMYFPVPLELSELRFLIDKNQIVIIMPLLEAGYYGIAPHYGPYELPAKLTNFKAGVRYYQTPFIKLPWLGFTANTSFIFEKIQNIRERPILGKIATNLLKNFANFTWEDFDLLYDMFDENIPLPDQISLKDIETRWVNTDAVPNSGVSENIFFIRPFLFDNLEITLKGFLSKDYKEKMKPHSCLMFVSIKNQGGNEENIKITNYVVDQLEKIDAKYNYLTFEASGQGVISTQINEVTQDANQIIMPIIFIVIIGILFISFRRISYVLLPMLALVVSIIWLFGTMVLLGIPFSAIAVALVPLILGLGVDYSVHLSHNYRLELAKGKTPVEAIKISLIEIGNAMFLAMLTTLIAFLSFLSASLPPIRDFGLLLALGIFYTFITSITLHAAMRYVIDRRKKRLHIGNKKTFKLDFFMGKIGNGILSHQKTIIVIILLITLIAGLGASQINTGFDFNSFLPEETPSMKLYEKIQENFPYASQQSENILLEGYVSSRNALIGIMKTHENFEDNTLVARNADGSVKATSIYTIIVQAVNNNNSLIEEFDLDEETKIPKTNQGVESFFDYLYYSENLGFQTKNCLHMNKAGRYDATVITVYIDFSGSEGKNSDLQSNLKILNKELNNDLENYGNVNAIVTGSLTITYIMTSSLTESQMLSTGISLVLAAIVLIIAYRRLTLGLIALIPVGISMIWILGTMFFIGYDLNILTITVTSLTIGIGIDYSIHATERFKLVADKTGDIQAAVIETISKTGGALLIAALTTTLGFAILVFAPIPPEQQFGVITAITITYSFIISVLALPLVLARWAKWTKKRKGYIISPKPAEQDYIEEMDSGKHAT
jgi:predicted RND superfamily exporter protein